MGNATLDISEVLQNIKADVVLALKDEKPMTIPVELCGGKKIDNSEKPILYSEELNYLNANWANFNPVASLSSHRRVIGPWIVRMKRLIIDFLWNNLFRSYFEHERDFNMQLVRHLNRSARYIDARDKEIFWQIIKKVDSDVEMLIERIDTLFTSALATAQSSEQHNKDGIDQVANQLKEIQRLLDSLRSKLS